MTDTIKHSESPLKIAIDVWRSEGKMKRVKPRLDPELAHTIRRAINARSVATDMINTVLDRDVYNHADFAVWQDQHIEATEQLGALGINLNTYMKE